MREVPVVVDPKTTPSVGGLPPAWSELALLRPVEVAELLGCSTRQVRAFAERGELPKVRLGQRSTRYRLSDVEAFIDAHVVEESA